MYSLRISAPAAMTAASAASAASGRLPLVASVSHDVKRESDISRVQEASTTRVQEASTTRVQELSTTTLPKVRTSRCDVDFQKMAQLITMRALGPPRDDSPPIWLIDVRDKSEVAREGKIPTSVNLPLGELKKALLSDCEDFDLVYGFPKPEKHHDNVIFYSINHVKSATAVEIAHRLGYRKARHYSGGYDDWINKQIDHMNFKVCQED